MDPNLVAPIGPMNFFYQDFFDKFFFLTQIFLDQEWTRPNINLFGHKFFWNKLYLDSIFFGPKDFSGQKIIMDTKLFGGQHFFNSKLF